MRRSPLVLLVCLLALATGLALLGVAQAFSWSIGGGPGTANAATAHRFYAAVDAALETGDRGALETVVAPGFVDHDPFPGVTADRAGLEQTLQALRTAHPSLTLEIGAIIADGDRVMARVTAHAAPETFLGMPMAGGPALWPPYDLFRLANGRIVEHWAAAEQLALPQPLLETVLPAAPEGPLKIGVTRLTLAPGARLPTLVDPGPVALAVETGHLDVDTTETLQVVSASADQAGSGGPAASQATAGRVTIGPGDRLVLPANLSYTLGNSGREPAVVLAVALFPVGPGAPRVDALFMPGDVGQTVSPDVATLWPQGIAAVPILRTKLSRNLPAGPAVLAVGRVALSPLARIPRHVASGIEVWSIAAGAGSLTLSWGDAQIFSSPSAPAAVATVPPGGVAGAAMSVEAGGTVVLAPGSAGDWRNAAATTLDAVVLTLTDDRRQNGS